MVRHMEIRLEKRGVSCVARLLDYEAPETADLICDRWRVIGRGRVR